MVEWITNDSQYPIRIKHIQQFTNNHRFEASTVFHLHPILLTTVFGFMYFAVFVYRKISHPVIKKPHLLGRGDLLWYPNPFL
jgi:hypothetical protein